MILRHTFCLLLTLMSSTVWAYGVLFPNFREGKISAYEYHVDQGIYQALEAEIPIEQSISWQNEYSEIISKSSGYCVQNHLDFLNQKISFNKRIQGKKLQILLSYIKLLRDRALLDDYAYDYLFNVVNHNSKNSIPLVHFTNDNKERMAMTGTIQNSTQLKKILSTIRDIKKRLNSGDCKDELYHTILNEAKAMAKVTTSGRWKNLLSQLYRHHVINKNEYRDLYALAKGKLFNRNYTLNGYRKKLLEINKIFSIQNEESTNYFRQFRAPGEMSDRMQLYNNTDYSARIFYKIKKLVDNLIERLDSDEIGIFLINKNKNKRDYTFSTLQQQRYALWMLKDEIFEQEFNISTKNKGISMQIVFAVGYEIGLFTSQHMEGVSILRNTLEPKVDDGIDWEEILQESFTAGMFLFPEKRTLLLLSSILVEQFFPSKEGDRELHVF